MLLGDRHRFVPKPAAENCPTRPGLKPHTAFSQLALENIDIRLGGWTSKPFLRCRNIPFYCRVDQSNPGMGQGWTRVMRQFKTAVTRVIFLGAIYTEDQPSNNLGSTWNCPIFRFPGQTQDLGEKGVGSKCIYIGKNVSVIKCSFLICNERPWVDGPKYSWK